MIGIKVTRPLIIWLLIWCIWAAFAPSALFIMPIFSIFICLFAAKSGVIFAVIMSAASVTALLVRGQPFFAMLCAALYLPVVITEVYCRHKRMPFWRSAGYIAAGTLAGFIIALGIMQMFFKTAPVDYFANSITDMIRGSEHTMQNYYIRLLQAAGVLPVPNGTPENLNQIIPVEIRETLFSIMPENLSQLFRVYLPHFIISQSIYCGACIALFPRMLIRNPAIAPYVPFSSWRMSNKNVIGLLAMLAVSLLLALIIGESLVIVYSVVFQTITLLFTIQGASCAIGIMRIFEMRMPRRIIIMALVLIFMRNILLLLGIFDQMLNLRTRFQIIKYRNRKKGR